MSPNARRASAVFEIRCDLCQLAAITRALLERGARPASRSHLLRLMIEDLHALLLSAGEAKEVDSVEEALEILHAAVGPVNSSGRGMRTVISSLELIDAATMPPPAVEKEVQQNKDSLPT